MHLGSPAHSVQGTGAEEGTRSSIKQPPTLWLIWKFPVPAEVRFQTYPSPHPSLRLAPLQTELIATFTLLQSLIPAAHLLGSRVTHPLSIAQGLGTSRPPPSRAKQPLSTSFWKGTECPCPTRACAHASVWPPDVTSSSPLSLMDTASQFIPPLGWLFACSITGFALSSVGSLSLHLEDLSFPSSPRGEAQETPAGHLAAPRVTLGSPW